MRGGPRASDADGALVRLEDQDRGRWDAARDRGGDRAGRALAAPGRVGPYQLQAAIAAVHDEARDAHRTRTGPRSSGLYEVLRRVSPSPVVELNRAVALGQVAGPEAGLAAVDALGGGPVSSPSTGSSTRPGPTSCAGWDAGRRRPTRTSVPSS